MSSRGRKRDRRRIHDIVVFGDALVLEKTSNPLGMLPRYVARYLPAMLSTDDYIQVASSNQLKMADQQCSLEASVVALPGTSTTP